MCNCIEEVNKQLAAKNCRLGMALFFSGKTQLLIKTVKLDDRSRKPVPDICASYCPFCGAKFEE